MTNALETDDALNLHANPLNENKNYVNSSSLLVEDGVTTQQTIKKSNFMEEKIQVWDSASSVRENRYFSAEELVKEVWCIKSTPKMKKIRKANKDYQETKVDSYKVEYSKLKETLLPLITFSSQFKNYRSTEFLYHYTGLVVLDIDLDDNADLPAKFDILKRNISNDPNTFMCFDSPKGFGYGLKVVVKVRLNERIKEINRYLKRNDLDSLRRKKLIDEVKSFHDESYKTVKNYYTKKYGFVTDKNAEGIMGGSFMSGDSNIYYNPNSSLINVAWVYCPQPKKEFNFSPMDISVPSYELMDKVIQVYFKGNVGYRNNTVFLLAMQVKIYGVSKEDVVQYALNRFGASDFGEKEIRRCVGNGFKNNYTPNNQFLINNSNNENRA